MKIIRLLFLGVMVGFIALGFSACRTREDHTGHQTAAAPQKYYCPMHPTYVSDEPGDCPICNMRLVPLEETDHKGHEASSTFVSTVSAVAGQAPVTISVEREQLIGVRTAPATKRDLTYLIRATGKVAYDPDLYNAIIEYQEAIQSEARLKGSTMPEAQERMAGLVRSSRLRLRQLGISDRQIDLLAQDFKNPTNLLLAQPGQSIWVYAQVYEYEAALVKPGQVLEATSSATPGRRYKGRVIAVAPILDSQTRTLRVRAEVENPGGLLKPEMFVDAVIHVNLGNKLSVPEEALLNTGVRQIVFVKKGEGVFEPREVKMGHEADGYYEVLSGLDEGEMVVTSANFLIDSESKLKAAFSGTGHQH